MKRVLVVSYDAGGAEVVSAWVKKYGDADYRFLLDGPAVKVFRRKQCAIDVLPVSEMEAGISAADFVLTGTGYGSNLEKIAISTARLQGTPVAAYLDHWTNYRERFDWEGREVLPSEIWAGDLYAFSLAEKTFPVSVVKLVPNEYLEEMREQIEAFPRPAGDRNKIRVLYVTEPTSVAAKANHGDIRSYGYTEYEALDQYLTYLEGTGNKVAVVVRPHPAETAAKYLAVIEKHRNELPVSESSGRTLAEDCAWADWVVGCDSMALVIALHAGKRVFSCIPECGPRMSLPYPEIIQLFKSQEFRTADP